MRIMRTTLAVDDHLLAAAKRRARARGQTLGQVVDDALRRELADPVKREPVEVPVFRRGGGPLPGIDLRSNRAIREVLDRGAGTAELR
jgi:Bacterial antitoxin of type II TA system, VapB